MSSIIRPLTTVLLLLISNVFMTVAWYGHLKFKAVPLYRVIIISWLIAALEYCFQVPANRIGYGYFTAIQLKTIQEVLTLTVFVLFSIFYLHETVRWNHLVGFAFIVMAVFFIFYRR